MAERQRSNGGNPHRKDAYDAISELEKFVPVDKHNLDGNLEEQPDIFYRVSKAYAISISEADIAKAAIDELNARLDAEVREDMEKAGDKVTEGKVKMAVASIPEMRAAVSNHLEKREISGRWLALKDSLNQRSYTLKELVALYSAGYFTDAVGGSARSQARDTNERSAGEARTRALAERGDAPSRRTRSRSDDE